MKKYIFLFSAVSILGLASCSDDASKTTTTTTATDTSMHATTTPAMDSANTSSTTTTKTTTTTTVTTRSLENRNLMTIKSNKPIKLVYSPAKKYYVDAATNNRPDVMYYYDPSTNDTFDYRGYNVNNALIGNNGSWKVDETRLMSNPYNVTLADSIKMMSTSNMSSDNMSTGNDASGKVKIKQKGDSYKEKTDTSKIKINDKMMKVKSK